MKDRLKVRVIISINVPKDKAQIVELFDELARVERMSRSELALRAFKEYLENHWPGNPQRSIVNPTLPALPALDPARAEARIRRAIVFLRFSAKLSYKQVADVVGKSYGYVYRLCSELGRFDNRRSNFRGAAKAFKKNILKYRKRFRAYVEGRFQEPEEAFAW